MDIDLTNVENIEDLRSVPPGEYRCRVAEARESESPAGHTRVGIRWEIVDGPLVGRTACWDSLHMSERGLPRVRFVLQKMGFDIRQKRLEAQSLVGHCAMVTIQTEEREDPVTGIRHLRNRVPFAGYAEDTKGQTFEGDSK